MSVTVLTSVFTWGSEGLTTMFKGLTTMFKGLTTMIKGQTAMFKGQTINNSTDLKDCV